jgi:O-acetylserine/cysteine efflux transporter
MWKMDDMNTARMTTARNKALLALAAACLLWGMSVPLSKAAMTGFGAGWLTVIRFGVAGVILLVVLRPRIRSVRPALIIWGALGYGGCIAIQNLGVGRTSVTHAALLIGAVPVTVAVLAVLFDGARVRAMAWAGFALSLAGIAVVAGAGGGDAALSGDALVLVSVVGGSAFTLLQARWLPGQDVVAVSAAQFLASAVLIAPIAAVTEGLPTPGSIGVPGSALLATLALATLGTVLPYTLFAFGQTGVAPEVAGAFLNLETLVAALIGVVVFGEPMGIGQGAGALALLGGIYLSTGRPAEPVAEPTLAPIRELAPRRNLLRDLELELEIELESVLEHAGEPIFSRAA